ncbi:flagellar export chaperone FliS [Jeongeupia naejangsanensis]|uniref:Flagellar secretion chaperone FliS n=1 Tax=Jeongeupia naejangsanensis TaxID=613195 RepID=A0ABS2BF31_9NEIS|nr:flagellar export chaperone FliS [Jeongeupia naejangsanensis]MBM3114209.1 flagellar export chaperone FliS [Jeongeupia naejangsanensis]
MMGLKKALNAYGQTSVEMAVDVASPHRLVTMLFEGAIKSAMMAKVHLEAGNIAEKGAATSKAIAIVDDGLRLSLDKTQGGALAENLDALYEYISTQLLLANLRNDAALFDEVLGLLTGLKQSWEAIDPAAQAAQAAEPPRTDSASVLSYGRA